MKNKYIDIIGMGPGSIEYILPEAIEKIHNADVLIGGRRNLEILSFPDKEKIELQNNLTEVVKYIQKNHINKQIAVLVSGDPGFHSLMKYISKNTEDIKINITPGISSFTYFFSKINMSWDDAVLSSVHGEKIDYISLIKKHSKIAFLTDAQITPKVIAKEMMKEKLLNRCLYIGEELSYPEEKISKINVEDAVNYDAKKLCVVVIVDE